MNSPQRHAALLLHAMAPADQQWLLSQLGDEEQNSIRTLISELTALGIPPDDALFKQTTPVQHLSQRPGAMPEASDEKFRFSVERLQAESPLRIHSVLAAEPAVVIARILMSQSWCWHTAVMRLFDDTKRQHILNAIRMAELARVDHAVAPKVPQALAQQLVASLLARLKEPVDKRVVWSQRLAHLAFQTWRRIKTASRSFEKKRKSMVIR
jgi:hypothetical protein